MFRSQVRDLILPQFEHSRLAGMLAWYWGNAHFDRPAIDFGGFARGVTLHDWHYGMLDNHPLGKFDDAEWLEIAEAGVSVDYADPVTDVVAKYHLHRLMETPQSAEAKRLMARLEAKIDAHTAETPYPPAAFGWADRITRFCDGVAFHFGFENRGWHSGPVCANAGTTDETDVAYEITMEPLIRFTPWPFSVADFSEQVVRFPAEGYPEKLDPEVALVHCVPAD